VTISDARPHRPWSVRLALPLVCLAAAIGAASYGAWWLLIDQTARIDTLAGRLADERPLPTDGGIIAQSFPIPAGGTDAACVAVRNTASATRTVRLQVQSDDRRAPAQVLARAVREVAAGGARACVDIPVPVALSRRDTTWWVTLRAVSAEASGGLSVLVAPDVAFPRGRLLVGGEERWGTLGLVVSAPASTRWHAQWPRDLYRPSRPGQLAGLLGVGSAIAAGGLWLASSVLATSARSAVATAIAVPAVLAVLHSLSTWTPRPPPIRHDGEGRALLDQLHDAEMHTTAGGLGEGFAVLSSDIRASGDRVLFALPESAVSWRVRVTDPISLDTAVALRQEAWTRPGDGATFTISVSSGDRSDILWQGHVDPFANRGARRWQDVTVRLDRYVGRDVTVTLATSAGGTGNAVMDAAMWREPVLRKSVMR
jgi:hypothetical protein